MTVLGMILPLPSVTGTNKEELLDPFAEVEESLLLVDDDVDVEDRVFKPSKVISALVSTLR